jgi:uncharacterized protein (TIGR03067 family)
MIPLMTFFVLVPLGDPATDKKEKLIAEEQKKLEGTWKVVKVEPSERKVKDDYRVVFKGNKVTFGDRPPYKFKLDPSKDPKWFDTDIAPLLEENEEFYAPGIYKLDGDKLILAMVTESTNDGKGQVFKPRPKNFTDKFHGGIMYLERVKAK